MTDNPKGKVVGQLNINDVARVLAFVELKKLIPVLGPLMEVAAESQKNLLWKQIEKELGLPPDRVYRFEFPGSLNLNIIDMGPIPKKGEEDVKKG